MNSTVQDARAIFHRAVRSVQADRLIGTLESEALKSVTGTDYERLYVLGMGKASMAMAGVLEANLPRAVTQGLVVVPRGYPSTYPSDLPLPHKVAVLEGGHPVPDEGSVEAGARMLQLADKASEDDLVVVLLSGGGSALCTAFSAGITLEDMQELNRLLLESGMDIHAMNAVRKHCSHIKGGQLARAAYPARVISLIISDVVGDELSVIASGPTAPDPTRYADAVSHLQQLDLWKQVPSSIGYHLTQGLEGHRRETPAAGSRVFARCRNHLLGSNRTARAAAAEEAKRRGYRVQLFDTPLTGEAREVGSQLIRERRSHVEQEGRCCLVWGGETTVTVRGSGRGGRNQELTLAAAIAMEDVPQRMVLLSGGTDGIDGPTDAAGAWATPATAVEARQQGLDPETFLAENNAYEFFDRLHGLIRTGPTHTNVIDIQLLIVP